MGAAQDIANLPLTNKLSILNGKASFLFPDKAENIARATNIMAADANANRETRIVFDLGQQRLVFFARELYVTSNNSLPETLANGNEAESKSKVLTNKDSLLSVLVTPGGYDSTESAILINTLYVKTQDNAVFSINAFINPEAYKNKAAFQQLTEKVFASLLKGERRINFKARTETWPIFGGNKKFVIALPEGFVVTKDKKYDFEVLKFQKIKDIADTNWLSLTIYTGHHPSYFYGEYDFTNDNAVKSGGKFLGKPVEWLCFTSEEKKLYLKEQKISADQIENGLIVHIAMLGNNLFSIDEITGLIEGIKLE
ncbi:hypothetical protein HNQ91_003129 [Filimonas zeae]|uniref:Uncharacterized protein n=1 Tax=Filimonas zeae TaxID=1737353 RepID=A0A917IZ86_9BACT|nr:hypothetical protein [Filimonas zeae]MDR6340064.1 hypothetical protein [Filimonas zeae]GGH70964.1 hypothetical protein GCM10011379_29800 [Filimonas zeae]